MCEPPTLRHSFPQYPKLRSRHSHSILSMHRNALIYQRKFFLETLKTRPPSRQNFSLMISKGDLRGSDFARFRRLSTTIDRFHPNRRRAPYRHGPEKRPSPLINPDAHVVMTVVLARRWAMVVSGRALSGRSLSGCVRSLPCAAGACSVVVRSAMVQELYQRSTPFVPITGRPGRICTRDGRGNDP